MKKIFSIVFVFFCCQNIHASPRPGGFLSPGIVLASFTLVSAVVGIRHLENQNAILKEENQKLISENNCLKNKEQVFKNDQLRQISEMEKKLEDTNVTNNDSAQTIVNQKENDNYVAIFSLGFVAGVLLLLH